MCCAKTTQRRQDATVRVVLVPVGVTYGALRQTGRTAEHRKEVKITAREISNGAHENIQVQLK